LNQQFPGDWSPQAVDITLLVMRVQAQHEGMENTVTGISLL